MSEHDALDLVIKIIDKMDATQQIMDKRQYEQRSEINSIKGQLKVVLALLGVLIGGVVGIYLKP